MKVQIKSKKLAAKVAAQSKSANLKAVSAKKVEVKTPSFKRETHSRSSVFAAATAMGIDSLRCWQGTEISDKLVNTLISNAEKLTSTRLAKAPNKVLVIEGRKAFAMPLVAQSGDIYEIPVDKRPEDVCAKQYAEVAKAHKTLRGSLSALREVYGAKKVHVLAKEAALKLLKGLKVDKPSLAQVTG